MPAGHGSIHDACSQGSKLKKKRLHCSGSRMRRCSPTDTWGGDMRYLNMASPKDFSSQSLYFLESYIEMGKKKWKKSSKSNRKLEQPPTEGQSPFKFAKKWAAEWLHQPRASTSHHCLSEKSIISPGCVCRKWWGFSLKSLPLVLYNHAYLHICIYLYIQTI